MHSAADRAARRERLKMTGPFLGAIVLAYAMVPLVGTKAELSTLVTSLGVVGAGITLIFIVPWQRLPTWSWLVIPVMFLIGVDFLRDAAGGSTSGYGPLILLPVLWVALYGNRRELAFILIAAFVTLATPLLLIGGTEYPSTGWRAIAMWLVVLTIMGIAVQDLVSKVRNRTAALKRQQRELIESKSLLDESIGAMSDALIAVDRNGHVLLSNEAARRVLDYGEHAIGLPIEQCLREDAQELLEPLHRAMQGESTEDLELTIGSDGHDPLVFSVSAVPMPEKNGWAGGGLIAMRDMTESVKRRQEADRLAMLVNATGDAVIGQDMDKRITQWNPAAEEMFGYPAKEAIGKSIMLIVLPEREQIVNSNQKRAAAGERLTNIEAPLRRKDGSIIDTSISLSAVRNANRVTGMSMIIRDVTAAKQAQREADRLKDEFVGVVSHELRTPLTSIIGFADLLRRGRAGDLNDKQLEFLDVITKAGDRQLRLVGDLLYVSEIESKQFGFDMEPVQLDQIVSESVETARVNGKQKQISVNAEIASLPSSAGDRDRLGQLIDNVIGNAIKFTPAEGAITVKLEEEIEESGPVARLSIHNSGSFISEADRRHLFDRFFRSESAQREAVQGLGLGLMISRAIADGHDGRIEVDSDEQSGTTFTVVLPIRAAVKNGWPAPRSEAA